MHFIILIAAVVLFARWVEKELEEIKEARLKRAGQPKPRKSRLYIHPANKGGRTPIWADREILDSIRGREEK